MYEKKIPIFFMQSQTLHENFFSNFFSTNAIILLKSLYDIFLNFVIFPT